MKNKISYVLGVVVVIGIVFFGLKNISLAPETDSKNDLKKEPDKTGIDIKLPDITLPFSNDPKDVTWKLFQKYLAYNKEKNLEGVRSVVYKVAPVCENPQQRIDCEARMASAYSYGSALKKEDFVNVWSDKKQIILVTDFWLESLPDDMDQYGRFRSIIFFIKGANDEWKLLSFSPIKGGATSKGSASQAEVDDRLIRYTEDNDKDGIADYEEECLTRPNDSTCLKTNPKLRDTDGDGLWDGVEALIK